MASEQGGCPAETALMKCPHGLISFYRATDGCQIAELEARGWNRATPGQKLVGAGVGLGLAGGAAKLIGVL